MTTKDETKGSDRRIGLHLCEMPEADRPREKALLHGIRELTDAELIAIQLRTGTKSLNALELARQLLADNGNDLYTLYSNLLADVHTVGVGISGLGDVKKLSILAAQELGVRTHTACMASRSAETSLPNSSRVYELMQQRLFGLREEQMWLITLNTAGRVTATIRLTVGTIDETSADVRLTLRHALRLSAASIILVHNHPGGSMHPSTHDDHFTHRLAEACDTIGIRLLDHLIYTDTGYYSYRDELKL